MNVKQFIQFMSEKRAMREAAANPGKPDGIADNQPRSVSVAKDEPRLNDTRKVSAKTATKPEMGTRKVQKPTAHVGKPALNREYMQARDVSVARISEASADDVSEGFPPLGGKSGRLQPQGAAQDSQTGSVKRASTPQTMTAESTDDDLVVEDGFFSDMWQSAKSGWNSSYRGPAAAHQRIQQQAAQNTERGAYNAGFPQTNPAAKKAQFASWAANPLIKAMRLQPAGKQGDYSVYAGEQDGNKNVKLYVHPKQHIVTLVMETREAVLEMQKQVGTSEELKAAMITVAKTPTTTKQTGEIAIKQPFSQTPTAKVGSADTNIGYMGRRDVKVAQIREADDLNALVHQARAIMANGTPAATATDQVVTDRTDPTWKKVYDSVKTEDDSHYDQQADMYGGMMGESEDPNLPNAAHVGEVELNKEFLELLNIDVEKIEEQADIEMTDSLRHITNELGLDVTVSEVYSPKAKYIGSGKTKKAKPGFVGEAGARTISQNRRRWM